MVFRTQSARFVRLRVVLARSAFAVGRVHDHRPLHVIWGSGLATFRGRFPAPVANGSLSLDAASSISDAVREYVFPRAVHRIIHQASVLASTGTIAGTVCIHTLPIMQLVSRTYFRSLVDSIFPLTEFLSK